MSWRKVTINWIYLIPTNQASIAAAVLRASFAAASPLIAG
jgi:hypothetical protein